MGEYLSVYSCVSLSLREIVDVCVCVCAPYTCMC